MIDGFEKLEVWQLGKDLVQHAYGIAKGLPKEELYCLASQIKRSALSVPANIAEGTGRFHFRDRVNFYLASRGSLYELRSHLLIAGELGFVAREGLQPVLEAMDLLGVKLNNLISATRKRCDKE